MTEKGKKVMILMILATIVGVVLWMDSGDKLDIPPEGLILGMNPVVGYEPLASTAPGDTFPHVRFADDAISLNDRCPVRKSKLNRRLPAIYVNGRPIGFC